MKVAAAGWGEKAVNSVYSMGSSKTSEEKKAGTLQFAVKSDDFPAQVQPELALVKPILPRLFLFRSLRTAESYTTDCMPFSRPAAAPFTLVIPKRTEDIRRV